MSSKPPTTAFDLKPAINWALFLDVDGTLLPFAERPDLVRVSDRLKSAIESIGPRLEGAIALVSGRTIEDLDRLFQPLQLPAAGLHAINPVPVTEAARIPDIEEVIDAQLVALRIIERAEEFRPAFDLAAADEIAQRLRAGAQRFKAAVLNGLAKAGIDAGNAFELLLALRRIGAKRLEEAFGPGAEAPEARRGRAPVVKATTISALERAAAKCLAHLSVEQQDAIANAKLTACVGASDVHEYGKILVEETLKALGVTLVDGGSHEAAARAHSWHGWPVA